VVALLFILVGVSSFAVTAGPRLFDRMADDGLRYDVAHATTTQRNIEFVSIARIPAAEGNPLGAVEARGRTLKGSLPDSVEALVDDGGYLVETSRFIVEDPPNYATIVALRLQGGIDAHVAIVEGRRPERVAPPVDPEEPQRIEVAISEATAAETKLRVGEAYLARIDPSDPILRTVFPRPVGTIEIAVVGLLAIRDPGAPYWFDDTRLAEIVRGGTEERPIAFVTALVAPETYRDLAGSGLPASYRWRLPLDPSRIDAGRLDALVPDLRRITGEFAVQIGQGSVALRTGLPAIIDRYLARRSATGAALSVGALGPLSVAAGSLGVVAILIVRRRRTELLLVRGRGASGRQLLLAQLTEGLLIAVPAAVTGALAAIAAVPSRSGSLDWVGAALVAAGATVLLLAATWPSAVRARRSLGREDPAGTRVDPRRIVLDGLAIGLAATAAVLLRERGLAAAGTAGEAAGGDPFLALTPVFIGLAAGLLTIRVYPLPVRMLSWAAARRRDLVPVLALRDIGRNPAASYLPLIILTLTVAIGSFASVVRMTIERGQILASWQAVGADYAVQALNGAQLDRAVDPALVEGAGAVASGYVAASAPVIWSPVRQGTARFLAIDPGGYKAVLRDAPVVAVLPTELDAPAPGAAAGSPGQPIPAVLSSRLATATVPLVPGDRFVLEVRGQRLTFEVTALADTFPGMGARTDFVVAPYAWLEGIFGAVLFRPTVIYVSGPAALGAALGEQVARQSPSAVAVSRHDAYAAMHEAPLVAGVATGFLLSLVIAAAYAALAVVASVILDAQRRAREVGFLRTLGATDRQAAGLTLIEHGLPTVVALGVGISLGLGVAWLLEPGLGLGAFIGPDADVRLSIDWESVAVVAGAVVALVALSVGISTWLAGRLDLGRILRIAED
jgi:putative ABC transport system permease protein